MYGRILKGFLLSFVISVAITSTATAAMGQTNGRLVHQIRNELVTLPYYGVFDWLQYEVRPNGEVVLSGQVVRPTTRSDAEGRVKELDGVKSVTNHIETLPLSPNDDRLRVALYRQIYGYNSPLFRYAHQAVPSIHLIVNRGHATLKGVVSNRGDANLAYIRARTVPGLFSVKNELTVENEQPR